MLGTRIERDCWDFPTTGVMRGNYVSLAPLSQDHLGDLWDRAHASPDSFTYLRYGPFEQVSELEALLADLSTRVDQPFWAVLNKDGIALGWISICDVSLSDGAFEIGSIWFSPELQGTREAREAIFLLMCLGMDTHHFERLVWRCQAQNEASLQAALNLGFKHEGTWRNAAVVDGWQRDVAWFSILKDEWPACKGAFTAWLKEENFDAQGQQIVRLQDFRKSVT